MLELLIDFELGSFRLAQSSLSVLVEEQIEAFLRSTVELEGQDCISVCTTC